MKTAYLASILIALIVAQIIPLASEEFGSGFYDEADNLSIELFKLNKS